jgi:hypothetical protein
MTRNKAKWDWRNETRKNLRNETKCYPWRNETKRNFAVFLFRETSEISRNKFFVSHSFVFRETEKRKRNGNPTHALQLLWIEMTILRTRRASSFYVDSAQAPKRKLICQRLKLIVFGFYGIRSEGFLKIINTKLWLRPLLCKSVTRYCNFARCSACPFTAF